MTFTRGYSVTGLYLKDMNGDDDLEGGTPGGGGGFPMSFCVFILQHQAI
jgi:hypothetical protein